MRIDGRDGSHNIEDRRGQSGGLGNGKSTGLIGIIVLLVGAYYGVDLSGLVGNTTQFSQPTQQQSMQQDRVYSIQEQQLEKLSSVVLKETENVWSNYFKKIGLTYQMPKLVLYEGATHTACGTGQASAGPFYCPGDHKLYIDLSFYNTMKNQLKAEGDAAFAYVLAHEVGHHVQTLLGTIQKVNQAQRQVSEKERDLEEIITEIEGTEQENKFLNLKNDRLEEENRKLKEDLKKYRNKEAEKIIEKQKKEIEKLSLWIKHLEQEIENMEQDESIEVVENINIKELSEEKKIDLTNQNVKVIGGRWSQKVIEKAEKYAEEKGFRIEFIHATAVFRNSDKLKNSDIIIFDTSYNSHSAYYKLKSHGLKIYRISTSNLDKIKKFSE